MTLLAMIFAVGLCAAGSALIVRAVVPQLWLMAKPFSCDLCMSWWSAVVSSVAVATLDGAGPLTAGVAAVGGTALSVVLLKATNRLDDRA